MNKMTTISFLNTTQVKISKLQKFLHLKKGLALSTKMLLSLLSLGHHYPPLIQPKLILWYSLCLKQRAPPVPRPPRKKGGDNNGMFLVGLDYDPF